LNEEGGRNGLTLEILEAIAERSDVTQRHLAKRAGVALGLANAYLKRCVRKGWVKIQQIPPNRYLYYLTPKGFAEKSRLTGEYLSASLAYYRRAGESCAREFRRFRRAGKCRFVLCGVSELAEIAALRALEEGVDVTGIYAPGCRRRRFLNLGLVRTLRNVPTPDVWMVTDLEDPQGTFDRLRAELGEDAMIVMPDILQGYSPAD